MMTNTLVAKTVNVLKKPIEAYYLDDEESISFFPVYLEFVIDRIHSDAENYSNASEAATIHEEKELLISMISRKLEMFDTFSAYRTNKYMDWFASTPGTTASENEFFLGNDFKSVQGLNNIFHFAYQKEYESLDIFKKANRSNLESAIHSLLERAAEHERQHILYLDSRLFNITRVSEPAYHHVSLTEAVL